MDPMGICPPTPKVRKRAKAFRLTVGEAWSQVRKMGLLGGKMGVSAGVFFKAKEVLLNRGH